MVETFVYVRDRGRLATIIRLQDGHSLPFASAPDLRAYAETSGRRTMPEFVKVAKTGDIAPGKAKSVELGVKRIAIFNIEGSYHAIDDTCTHRGGPLSEGMIVGTEVTCPWHGAVFDVTTGSVLGLPAPRSVARYALRIDGDDIKLEL
jgi:nitrite reductase/ring-hydroxylating ferredoxin subunit